MDGCDGMDGRVVGLYILPASWLGREVELFLSVRAASVGCGVVSKWPFSSRTCKVDKPATVVSTGICSLTELE